MRYLIPTEAGAIYGPQVAGLDGLNAVCIPAVPVHLQAGYVINSQSLIAIAFCIYDVLGCFLPAGAAVEAGSFVKEETWRSLERGVR